MSTHRPDALDAADTLVSAIVGAARPVVDAAIDRAALIALDAVLTFVDDIRSHVPGVPAEYADGSFHGVDSQAYMAGWDDGLAAVYGRVMVARNRIQRITRP